MAIVKEYLKTRKDGTKLYKTYSNKNYKIKQKETGIIYENAVDVESSNYTYEETNELIEEIEETR